MKRASDPIFWALFGAGGMLAALVGPVLIFITGLAVPFGFILPQQTMSYGNMLALAQNPIGKLAILAVISLFLFHGCHRLFHCFHDVGIRSPAAGKFVFFGFATTVTVITAVLLLAIGF
jgi:fumarate reductase subunit D